MKEKITDIVKASSDAIAAGASSVSTAVASASNSTLEAGRQIYRNEPGGSTFKGEGDQG